MGAASIGCTGPREAYVTPAGPPHDAAPAATSADGASAEPSADRPDAPAAAPSEAAVAISNVKTFVTTSGPPGHVRLSVDNRAARPSTLRIEKVEWIDAGARRALTLGEVAWDAGGERRGSDLVIGAKERLVLVVSLRGDLPRVEHYAFVVTARVDGAVRDVEAIVDRARREPMRR